MKHKSLFRKIVSVSLLLMMCQSGFSQFVIGTIPKGDSIIIQHDVTIIASPPMGTNHVAAQWTIMGSNFAPFLSDDPDTGTPLDSTKTLIQLCNISTLPVIKVLHNPLCPGSPDTLVIMSGTLGDATHWQWYTSSCGGTPATVQNVLGDTLFISPSATTTYYVRGEGDCVTGAPCASVTVNMLTISAPTVTQPTCAIPSGTIVVNTNVGTSILEYRLNGGPWQTSATFSGLTAGNYNIDVRNQGVTTCLTVTDMNNCSVTTSAIITTLPLPCGWTAEANGVGCSNGNSVSYNFNTQIFTATSTNCYYPNPFTSDQLAFAQHDLCGNGSITARVTSISGGLGWAGVIMRESNAPGAKKAQLMTNLSNFSRREFRATTNGTAYPQQFQSMNRYWLRITRIGTQFSMEVSPNGSTWYFAGAQNISMTSCIEVGLVVTNYTANSTVTVTFANVSVSGGMTRPLINTPEDMLTIADFNIYPNPTNGLIEIDLSSYNHRKVQLEMFNLQGKLLRSLTLDVEKDKEEFDLTSFASGMYLIRVRTEGMPDITKRLVLNSNQ